MLAVASPLSISGMPNVAILASGTLSGNYTLATFGSTAGLSLASFHVTGVPSGYVLQVDPTDLMLVVSNASQLSLSPSHLRVRSMVGGNQTGIATLSNRNSSFAAAYATSITGSAAANPATGSVATSGTADVAIGFSDYSTAGARSGSVMFSNTANPGDGFDSANNTVSLDSGSAVVANRSVTAGTVSLSGIFHVGTDLSGNTTTPR